MLQSSSSPSPSLTPATSPPNRQSPAAAWIQRLNAPRSTSFDAGLEHNVNANGISALGYGRPGQEEMEMIVDENGAGPSNPAVIASDLRRATSLRTAGVFGGAGRETVSFGAAGSNLTSPPNPAAQLFTPPLASRHPLFSHHAVQAPASTGGVPSVHSSDQGPSSPAFMSDPGPSGPPSPSASDLSSSAFSPASAFLSHFSSSMSLRPPQNLAPDAQGAKVSDYILGKIIGRGGFSTVRKATHVHTGEVLACKIVKRDDLSDRSGSLEKFEDEIKIWQSLPKHPSLLPLVEMHRTPFATFLFTPYMSGGSLLDVLQREGGSDKTARKWFPGVVNAVQVLHEGHEGFEGGILHGDLKLDNFLVDQSGSVMVADFYMAQKIQDKDHNSHQESNLTVPPPLVMGHSSPLGRHSTLPAGYHRGPRMSSPLPSSKHRPNEHPLPENITPHPTQPFPSASLPYAPPELLRAPPAGPSLAQDVWALGIILHALLTGRLPFVDAFDPRLQMKILRGAWEEPAFLGREWLECLHGCLDGNKETRWTVRRVKESDAVSGWAEVKSRSKSRSRSRARMGMGLNDGYVDTIRRDGSAGPVSIGSPFGRGRTRKHSTASSNSASASRDRMYQQPQAYDDRLDVFTSTSRPPSTNNRRDDPRHPRSRSASASRSRSSGNDHRPMFTLDAPDLVRSLESVDTARGRTTRRGETNNGLNIPGLPYARHSGEVAITGLPIPGYSNSRSGSRSRPRIAIQPQSAPSYPTNFGTSLSSATTSSYNPMNVPPHSPGTSRSRSSHSPSVSRGGRSLSRSRDSPVWEVSQQAPERYSYGRELDMVHEEKGRVIHEEDRHERERGRTGRSRSRGRAGRGY
ncbi:CAMK protein kinase [Kwoniella mangroviensis CBS 10435]|uniref:CAMK protein kinase n=1 Tax=Kwoniella mangroviensis CBS 10435 TaxID=1331196 RepID=A0A1B9J2I7_9TREE|nr:CAMK protein kinase [Kwoniella mangroviensis CBS 10435]